MIDCELDIYIRRKLNRTILCETDMCKSIGVDLDRSE